MVRKQTILDNIGKISSEIERFKEFRITPESKKFLRQLHGERMTLQGKIRKLEQTTKSKEEEKQKRRTEANKKRSQKMRRLWNYFRSITKNYDTGMTERELRTEFSKFRRGLETDIQDVIWRNPSP